jgi:hypothetical protein
MNHCRTLPATDNTPPAAKSDMTCIKSKGQSATMRVTSTQILIARLLTTIPSTKPEHQHDKKIRRHHPKIQGNLRNFTCKPIERQQGSIKFQKKTCQKL